MKRSVIYAMIALALAAAAFVACSGGSKSNKEQAEPTVAQQQDQKVETPEGKATEAKATPKSGSSSGSDGSIDDVPVYPGAKETTSGEWWGSDAAIPAIGAGANAGNYKKVQWARYETSDGAGKVLDWYKDKMSGWVPQGSLSGEEEGSGTARAAWTKDDGIEAAWIAVGEDSGTTTLSIFYGTQ